MDRILKTVLPNGATVISDQVKRVNSVSVGLWVLVGSRDENVQTNGVYHFLEHLVFKGTKKRDYIELSQSLERVGGYLNAFTTKEQTCFYAHVLGEHLELAVDVLSDITFNPSLPKKEFEKEKLVIIEELKSIDDDPEELIFEAFDKLVYPNHPLGLPIAGTPKTLKAMPLPSIATTAKQAYIPSRILLVASGNVNHDSLVRLAETFFIPNHTKKTTALPKRNSFLQTSYKPKHKTLAKNISQAHITIGAPFERFDDEYFSTLLLNTILGGSMSSRLNIELREKMGLAYSVFTNFSSYDDSHTLCAYVATDKRSIKKATHAINIEFDKLAQTKVSKKELDLAKNLHRGGILMGAENMTTRMNNAARDEYYFGRNIPVNEYLELTSAVTPEQIIDVAQKRLNISLLSSITLIPS